jgi:hypothetical protein
VSKSGTRRPASGEEGRGKRSGKREEKEDERGDRKHEVPPVAREVVSSLLARATGPLNPSLIKETIVRKEPDFDERDYGFSTFSRLLEAMEKEKLLRRQQLGGKQWYVVSPDVPSGPAPEEAAGPEDAGS